MCISGNKQRFFIGRSAEITGNEKKMLFISILLGEKQFFAELSMLSTFAPSALVKSVDNNFLGN